MVHVLKTTTPDYMIPLDVHLSSIPQKFAPKTAEPIIERITREYKEPLNALATRRQQINPNDSKSLSKFEYGELSGDYSKIVVQLEKCDREIIKDLESQRKARIAAIPHKQRPDKPELREIYLLRLDHHADRLRQLPPEQLVMRIKNRNLRDIEAIQHADAEGWPVPAPTHREIVASTLNDVLMKIAEEQDPQIAELGAIHGAYEYAHNVVATQVRKWAESDGINVESISQAYLLSGQPVSVGGRK
jgi:hypothetical protein